MVSVAEFINVDMNTLSFLSEDIEARETIVSIEDKKTLDLKRLLDRNDSYEEILFNPNREIVLKDGEYVLAVPEPKEVVAEESIENTHNEAEQLIWKK